MNQTNKTSLRRLTGIVLLVALILVGAFCIVKRVAVSANRSLIQPPLSVYLPSVQKDFNPTLTPNPPTTPTDVVWEMLGQVNRYGAVSDLRKLSGEEPICNDNRCYTISNRLTGSEGLQWAKNYISDKLVKLGYSVELNNWSTSGYADQNLIAKKLGVSIPNEKVYFVAHMDGMKMGLGEHFPAADDNASGVVDILELARILSGHSFSRTIVLFFSSGEEQGELGIQSYLSQLSPIELSSIKDVVDVDMVGYDANGDAVMELWHGDHSPSLALTQLMSETIKAYQINLVPILVVGCGWGDEIPFRAKGLPTALQIENYNGGERNPYMHTPQDTIAHMNIDYWLEQMKATIAIAAQLIGPIGR